MVGARRSCTRSEQDSAAASTSRPTPPASGTTSTVTARTSWPRSPARAPPTAATEAWPLAWGARQPRHPGRQDLGRSQRRRHGAGWKSAMDWMADASHVRQPGAAGDQHQRRGDGDGSDGHRFHVAESSTTRSGPTARPTWSAAATTGPGSQTIWSPGVAKNALTVGNVIDNGYLVGRGHQQREQPGTDRGRPHEAECRGPRHHRDLCQGGHHE